MVIQGDRYHFGLKRLFLIASKKFIFPVVTLWVSIERVMRVCQRTEEKRSESVSVPALVEIFFQLRRVKRTCTFTSTPPRHSLGSRQAAVLTFLHPLPAPVLFRSENKYVHRIFIRIFHSLTPPPPRSPPTCLGGTSCPRSSPGRKRSPSG